MRRAHDGGVRLAWENNVVRIAPEPLDQARVLDPPDRLADGELLDGYLFVRHARPPSRERRKYSFTAGILALLAFLEPTG